MLYNPKKYVTTKKIISSENKILSKKFIIIKKNDYFIKFNH